MRAFGPGSISSFLKVVLDVVYALLWVLAAALVVGAVALVLALPFGTAGGPLSALADLDRRGPETAASVVLAGLYLAALIVVCERLRRVFGTLIAGDPFDPENVARMRTVGLALIVLELSAYGLRYTSRGLLAPGSHLGVRFGVDLNFTAWFAILVVFVLAEVFREGARLRAEAEFTV